MTLFNYNKCECCKKLQNNINVELIKVLPSSICNQITDSNVYCDKCRDIIEKDQQHCKNYIFFNGESRFYNQLIFFLKYNKNPKPFSCQCSKTHYNKNIDELFKDEDLIERFGGGFKNVKKYRAFAKEYRELFMRIEENIDDVETIERILKRWNVRKDAYFKYYGKKYSVVLLICLILWEMIYEKIGKENVKYIDEDYIMKYVDTIMDDYLPKE